MFGMATKLFETLSRGTRLLCGELDRAAAAGPLGDVPRQTVLRPHDTACAEPTGLRVEAAPIRVGAGSRAREKNDGSAAESGTCRLAV